MGAAIASILTDGMALAGIGAAGVIVVAWAGAVPWVGAAGMRRAAACIAKGPVGARWIAIWTGAGTAPHSVAWSVAPSVARPLAVIEAAHLGLNGARPQGARNAALLPAAVSVAPNLTSSAPEMYGHLRALRGLAEAAAALLRGAPLRPDPTERGLLPHL